MRLERSSGLLLHPTSLPGPLGIGDLGPEARRFAGFLRSSRQRLWQVLPLGPPSFAGSPYQALSAFAGNTLLISPEDLVGDGLLDESDLTGLPGSLSDRADFESTRAIKDNLLRRAFANFAGAREELREDFNRFCAHSSWWLDDYALFQAIKGDARGAIWAEWEEGLRRRQPAALSDARERLAAEIEWNRFTQYLFFRQWLTLRSYCNELGIRIIGDMPIFVAHDSADVWVHPELFKLDESGQPRVVSGVPPDLFSTTGQLWGNPLYDWDEMRRTGYYWWVARVGEALRLVDIIRIDHFRGFAACWEVPVGDETAEHGRWEQTPGRELFSVLKESFPSLPIIAEDLGTITPDVTALREELGVPGMRVLQFAFGDDSRNPHLPHNYERHSVVYTGTHDNDTTIGWFNARPEEGSVLTAEQIERERRFALAYLNSDGSDINWDFVHAALGSVADLAILPLQDVLGLGSGARMNLPASPDGNWAWRFERERLTPELARRLRTLTSIYGRAASPFRSQEADWE